MPGQTTVTLTFPNATLTQGALYAVTVENAWGAITSTPPDLLTVLDSVFKPAMQQTSISIQTQGFALATLLQAGQSFRLQASTNLATWADLTNFTSTGLPLQFMDI